MNKCEYCKQSFEGCRKTRPTRFCSKRCNDLFNMAAIVEANKQRPKRSIACEYCGKQCFAKRSDQCFCSPECHYEGHKKRMREKNDSPSKVALLPERACHYCEKTFRPNRVRDVDQKFCSPECHYEGYKKRVFERHKQERAKILKTCPICDKQFTPKQNKRQKFCSVQCSRIINKKCYKAVRSCLKYSGQKKMEHTREILGYSPKQLHDHIVTHPNWEYVKHGKWHLDHIFPIKAFIDHGITDISVICSLSNLQPLSASENLSKGDTYNKEAFTNFLKATEV